MTSPEEGSLRSGRGSLPAGSWSWRSPWKRPFRRKGRRKEGCGAGKGAAALPRQYRHDGLPPGAGGSHPVHLLEEGQGIAKTLPFHRHPDGRPGCDGDRRLSAAGRPGRGGQGTCHASHPVRQRRRARGLRPPEAQPSAQGRLRHLPSREPGEDARKGHGLCQLPRRGPGRCLQGGTCQELSGGKLRDLPPLRAGGQGLGAPAAQRGLRRGLHLVPPCRYGHRARTAELRQLP